MNTVPMSPELGESHPNYHVIVGLLQLAAFLTDHPNVPVQAPEIDVAFYVSGTDSDKIAQVRLIGREIDADPVWDDDGHSVRVERAFGPAVKYQAVAHMQQSMDDYRRRQELGWLAFRAEKAVAAAAAAAEMVVVVDGPAAEQPPADREPAECHECQFCTGTGMEGNGTCPHCLGAGRPLSMADLEPPQADTQQCPDCRGSGALEQEGGACRSCWGTGRVLTGPPDCALCGGTGRGFDEFGLECNLPCGTCHGTGYQPPMAVKAW